MKILFRQEEYMTLDENPVKISDALRIAKKALSTR